MNDRDALQCVCTENDTSDFEDEKSSGYIKEIEVESQGIS